MKTQFFLFLTVAFFWSAWCPLSPASADQESIVIVELLTRPSNGAEIKQIFSVEVADTPSKRAAGLMLRPRLEHDGMLFVFEGEGRHGAWMKDTFIPLTFLWFDEWGKLVGQVSLKPFDLTIFPAPVKTRYAVALATEKLGSIEHLEAGDTMTILRSVAR